MTHHARIRARQRNIPMRLVEQVYWDPDRVRPSRTTPDREIRSRRYHEQVMEIVVDLTDGSVVSVWFRASDA